MLMTRVVEIVVIWVFEHSFVEVRPSKYVL